jgi:hypothetical protein
VTLEEIQGHGSTIRRLRLELYKTRELARAASKGGQQRATDEVLGGLIRVNLTRIADKDTPGTVFELEIARFRGYLK